MIHDCAKSYFQIADTDSAEAVLNKRYLLDRDRITKQIKLEQRINDFEKKYNEIKRMKSRTTLEQLKLQLAIEELLNE